MFYWITLFTLFKMYRGNTSSPFLAVKLPLLNEHPPRARSSSRDIYSDKRRSSSVSRYNSALSAATQSRKTTTHGHQLSLESVRRAAPMGLLKSQGYKCNTIDARNLRRVTINISGVMYETLDETLNRFPKTLLGTEKKRERLKDLCSNQIYFNRNRIAFESILFFYQSNGSLSRPLNLSIEDFEKECLFFELPTSAIKKMKERENCIYRKPLEKPKNYIRLRHILWQCFQYPLSQKYALLPVCYFLFSYLLVLCSICIFCIESEVLISANKEFVNFFEEYVNEIHLFELTINIFFGVELLIRFVCYPWPIEFLKRPLNFITMFSVLIYITIYEMAPSKTTQHLLNFSRVLRTILIARLDRVSLLLRTATAVFKDSFKDFMVVVYIILIISVICGSLMYYIEMDEPNTMFTSIPESMWWAIQTVLCLGYGDIYPKSVLGKLAGCFILYFGVTIVTILVLALGGRFFDTYSKEYYKKDFILELTECEVYY